MTFKRLLLSGSTRIALWYVVLAFAIPLVTLLALGIIYLWQQQLLLMTSIVWLAVTLLGYSAYRFWPSIPANPIDLPDTLQAQVAEALPGDLSERADWTRADQEIWHIAKQHINNVLEQDPNWQDLPEISIALLERLANEYSPDGHGTIERLFNQVSNKQTDQRTATQLPFKFTLPEALLVLSIASERYRTLIINHIPFADKITLSSLLSIYDQRSTLGTGLRWVNTARRTARFSNPIAAVVSELRDQFTGRIFSQLNKQLQGELKKLLLQEIAQVGMDLYSGRLRMSAAELHEYESENLRQDELNIAEKTEPLRIALLGQVSSGKSTLINAVSESLQAETDILPSSDKTTVHVLTLDEQHSVHLIDTEGMTANTGSITQALELALSADMILLVVRATQPARAPDKQLLELLSDAYDQNHKKRQAPIALVMTHVDQLSPKGNWSPPYDLESSDKKSQTIRLALISCIEQLALPADTPAIPVCVADTRAHYNVDLLAAQIKLSSPDATQTQLNRKRLERDVNRGGLGERWSQARSLGRVLGKTLLKSS